MTACLIGAGRHRVARNVCMKGQNSEILNRLVRVHDKAPVLNQALIDGKSPTRHFTMHKYRNRQLGGNAEAYRRKQGYLPQATLLEPQVPNLGCF